MSQVSSELEYKIKVSDLSKCVAIWSSRESKREGFMILRGRFGLRESSKNADILLVRALDQKYYI